MKKDDRVIALILAAGKGTRMRSSIPKVLHQIMGVPMIRYVLRAVTELNPFRVYVVVGPNNPDIVREVTPTEIIIQHAPLGVADGIRAAEKHIRSFTGDILVICGDSPMIDSAMLKALIDKHQSDENSAITVLATRLSRPTGYGRLVLNSDGSLAKIVEEAEVGVERDLNLVNAGAMIFDGTKLFVLLDQVTNDNLAGEYYSTDMVKLATKRGWRSTILEDAGPPILSVNTPEELREVERELRTKLMQ